MAKLQKFKEELEFVKSLGKVDLYRVKEDKNHDLLEKSSQSRS